MIINEVRIKNFFCFIDETISFSNGLNIISAKNGDGKSMLFNAFHWTLFDSLYVQNSGSKKEWINKSANIIVAPDKLLKETIEGEKVKSSVEIDITAQLFDSIYQNEGEIKYTFLKSVIYEKSNSKLIIYQKPELVISYVLDGETKYISSHQHDALIQKIFPKSIRKFMWYQGESMDDLYDFSNPSTLKYAINVISYFPMYDIMDKIVKESVKSISNKIDKELKEKDKLTTSQKKLISDITENRNKILDKQDLVRKIEDEIDSLRDEITNIEHKMLSYDKYRDIKEKINKLESELKSTKDRLDDAESYTKETLINKWMLYKCDEIIALSEDKLNIINRSVQNQQQSTNPIPLSLPGPEYVEKMLTDNRCYICEREVEENSPAYDALKRRLNDFEKNLSLKVLQDNYIDLNKIRKRLLEELPKIKLEIDQENEKKEKLIKQRNSLNKQIKEIYETSGDEQGQIITTGASNYSQLLSKLNSYKSTLNTKINQLNYQSQLLTELLIEQKQLQEKKLKEIKITDSEIVEIVASNYINLFSIAIEKLKNEAYTKLINEIQEESNKLYLQYMGGNTQGKIVIGKDIQIVDKETNERIFNFGGAESVIQKIAVAFSFLAISARKLKISYPIISDAPTSDFDPFNTIHFTKSLSNSFEQMIIMSKDYLNLTKQEVSSLIKDANIAKYYEFSNELIDKSGIDSRTNKKTFITIIK
jgi:DNA sulfur modification protein DndD